MKCVVVYDSMYGNTEKIARAIAKETESELIDADRLNYISLENIDLLFVCTPTQGGRPTVKLIDAINRLPGDMLRNKRVAVFDTRILEQEQNFALRLLVRMIGYAAPKLGKMLEAKGAVLAAPPEGFIVKGKTGPLARGEIERAIEWAGDIIKK